MPVRRISITDVSRKYVTVDNVTLAYEDYGGGPAIVFIHGYPASAYSWREVARQLSGSHHCICFDLMGFGHSDKPLHERYTIERQAELILGAAREMGLNRFVLAGHSMGGGVALSIMRKLGTVQDTVRALVLVNSVCYPQVLPWFMLALWVPMFPRLVMKLIPERWGFMLLRHAMYHRSRGMKPEAIEEYSARLQSKGAHAALMSTARHIVPRDIQGFVELYSSICVPTQLIWGKRDRVVGAKLGRKLAKDIPDSRLLEIDDCGHVPQEEYPELVGPALRRFIDEVDATGAG